MVSFSDNSGPHACSLSDAVAKIVQAQAQSQIEKHCLTKVTALGILSSCERVFQ